MSGGKTVRNPDAEDTKMMQTLTEFFHSWGWETATLAIVLFIVPATSFLYVDLKGIMSRKTLWIILAIEATICSTEGFGEPVEMIKGSLMALFSAVVTYLFFEILSSNNPDW